jgi:hypothetical protein
MIIIPAQLESYRSLKDRTLKITFETNELNGQDLLGVAENLNRFGFLAFKTDPFREDEKQAIEAAEVGYGDKGKTPSQRLRGVLYVLYQKDNEGFDTFTRFYDHHMEKLLKHYKDKLD